MAVKTALGAGHRGIPFGGRGAKGKGATWNKPRRAQLTDAFVEALPRPPAGKKDYWMRDTRIAGFSVRVYAPDEHNEVPKIFGYTIAVDGKEKYFRIGRFGIMTAVMARSEAQKIDENVRHGKDPYAHRQDVSLATVNDLFEEWKENYWPTGLAESTQARYQRFWERFIPRTFKLLQLSQVELSHIQEIQKNVIKGGIRYSRRRKINFVEVKSAPSSVQANRIVAMLSGLFRYQLKKKPDQRQGLDHNPCKAITLEQENEEFVYLDRHELLSLRAFLEAQDSRCKPYSRAKKQFAGTALDAIDLIFHTGLRHREALKLDWSSVHFELGTLSIKVTKYGAKRPRTARTKHIRITSPARTLLTRLWETAGQPKKGWVFPSHLHPDKHWDNIQGTWDAIREHLDLPKETRLHDLRHSMATDLLRSGMDRGEVQAYMGWESLESANRYMHVVTKETHLKAEAIIATRGIDAADGNAAQLSRPIRSKAGVNAKGLLQEVVDHARDLLAHLAERLETLPDGVRREAKALRAALNPDLAGEGAWTPEDQFLVACKASQLCAAIMDPEEGLGSELNTGGNGKAVKELVGYLMRLGLIEP